MIDDPRTPCCSSCIDECIIDREHRIEQATLATTYYDAEGNSAPLDEALS